MSDTSAEYFRIQVKVYEKREPLLYEFLKGMTATAANRLALSLLDAHARECALQAAPVVAQQTAYQRPAAQRKAPKTPTVRPAPPPAENPSPVQMAEQASVSGGESIAEDPEPSQAAQVFQKWTGIVHISEPDPA